MKEASVKKRLRLDFELRPGDAAKRCLDRIRHAKAYPHRARSQKTVNPEIGNGQKRSTSLTIDPIFSITCNSPNGQSSLARFACQHLEMYRAQRHNSRAMF